MSRSHSRPGALPRRAILSSAVGAALAAGCRRDDDAPLGPLLAPSALAARIDDVRAGKIVVFYVGPSALFSRHQIPGARRLEALDSESGRRALTGELARVPAGTEIVLYCGCCPVRSCPNVRPASAALRALGRSDAHLLDLPTRFSTDWTDKGYPVAT